MWSGGDSVSFWVGSCLILDLFEERLGFGEGLVELGRRLWLVRWLVRSFFRGGRNGVLQRWAGDRAVGVVRFG